MSLKVIGIKKFADKLGRMKSKIIPDVKRGVDLATIMVEGQAKLLCPTNRYQAGGELRQSIHPSSEISKDRVEGKVSTIKEYAMFVEFGTGIKGQLSNRNNKIALAYRQTPWTYTPDNGETFYRTIGNVAQPFLYPALHANRKAVRDIIIKSVRGITK